MNMHASAGATPRSLSRRSVESEWLDDADVNPADLKLVLRDLARFNGAMLGHWPVIAWLRRALRDAPKDRPLTIVDVGCGYGDLLRAIRRWSRKRGLAVRLIGVDLNHETIAIARDARMRSTTKWPTYSSSAQRCRSILWSAAF